MFNGEDYGQDSAHAFTNFFNSGGWGDYPAPIASHDGGGSSSSYHEYGGGEMCFIGTW
jgi:hypothetical protein